MKKDYITSFERQVFIWNINRWGLKGKNKVVYLIGNYDFKRMIKNAINDFRARGRYTYKTAR